MTDKNKHVSLKLDKKGLKKDYIEWKEQTTLDGLFKKKEDD